MEVAYNSPSLIRGYLWEKLNQIIIKYKFFKRLEIKIIRKYNLLQSRNREKIKMNKKDRDHGYLGSHMMRYYLLNKFLNSIIFLTKIE